MNGITEDGFRLQFKSVIVGDEAAFETDFDWYEGNYYDGVFSLSDFGDFDSLVDDFIVTSDLLDEDRSNEISIQVVLESATTQLDMEIAESQTWMDSLGVIGGLTGMVGGVIVIGMKYFEKAQNNKAKMTKLKEDVQKKRGWKGENERVVKVENFSDAFSAYKNMQVVSDIAKEIGEKEEEEKERKRKEEADLALDAIYANKSELEGNQVDLLFKMRMEEEEARKKSKKAREREEKARMKAPIASMLEEKKKAKRKAKGLALAGKKQGSSKEETGDEEESDQLENAVDIFKSSFAPSSSAESKTMSSQGNPLLSLNTIAKGSDSKANNKKNSKSKKKTRNDEDKHSMI
jgi:hypothetical protein